MTESGVEALPDFSEWTGGQPGCLGVVGIGREDYPDFREWSGGPPGCPKVVGMPFRMSGSGWDTLPDVR